MPGAAEMTCPACSGPIDAQNVSQTVVCVCVWCTTPLVLTGGEVRPLTDDELAALAPGIAGKLHEVRNAARLYGAARRN
jgi:hypothetical protein